MATGSKTSNSESAFCKPSRVFTGIPLILWITSPGISPRSHSKASKALAVTTAPLLFLKTGNIAAIRPFISMPRMPRGAIKFRSGLTNSTNRSRSSGGSRNDVALSQVSSSSIPTNTSSAAIYPLHLNPTICPTTTVDIHEFSRNPSRA